MKMTRNEQLDFLIREQAPSVPLPQSPADKWHLFRALVNQREPSPVSDAFLKIQDSMLQAIINEEGVTDAEHLHPARPGLYLWKGDITTLRVDAIVNAANSGLLGCFRPNHSCIDNSIHTFAGVQLRLKCHEIMRQQGYLEPAGQAKITSAYNLPSRFILHTVGPTVEGVPTELQKEQLRNCYASCLALADRSGLESVAFCCISTGVFHFPNEQAAEIAVDAVSSFLDQPSRIKKVIFNVFTERDEQIYKRLLD
jgi:O-acetyl-ADP-ribose deacetylase (regulator of RNase III)